MIKKLAGQTIFITGASRGIGKAIALRCAQDGANIVIAAKTAEAHPKLPGTIYTAAKEVEAAGGRCLPCIVDVRDEQQVIKAFEAAAAKFGGVDILINNASAIHLTGTVDTPMKRYDLMHSINIRGTFLCSKVAIPYLRKSRNPHILNISPPLSMKPLWFKNHVAYTMAKYGMSMCVLGMAEEFKSEGIAVNALWPVTAIVTAAMEMLAGGDVADRCRKPEIMADAAYVILSKNSKEQTGKFLIDEVVLREAGTTDFDKYAVSPGTPLLPDFFLDDVDPASLNAQYEKHEQFKKQKAGAGSGSGGVAPIFDRIKGLLSPELIKSIGGIYQFELHGGESGSWFLDMKNGKGAVGKGKPAEAAACTMSMDSVDFVKMFSGQLKPTAAFMSGKLKVKGDMGMAMKLDRLMGQLNAKL